MTGLRGEELQEDGCILTFWHFFFLHFPEHYPPSFKSLFSFNSCKNVQDFGKQTLTPQRFVIVDISNLYPSVSVHLQLSVKLKSISQSCLTRYLLRNNRITTTCVFEFFNVHYLSNNTPMNNDCSVCFSDIYCN